MEVAKFIAGGKTYINPKTEFVTEKIKDAGHYNNELLLDSNLFKQFLKKIEPKKDYFSKLENRRTYFSKLDEKSKKLFAPNKS